MIKLQLYQQILVKNTAGNPLLEKLKQVIICGHLTPFEKPAKQAQGHCLPVAKRIRKGAEQVQAET